MKKILSISLLSQILFQIYLPMIALGQAEDKTFIVTAYYSPLPNQSFYLRGNYEDEVILNGEGTHGASGKGVFPGMLAAPKNYPFGTKIELDGIGLGSVEDRGGAIVNAGKRGYEHDRIDVWMGYGEDGLKKALNWGKRKIEGKVYGKIKAIPTIALGNIAGVRSLPKTSSEFNIFYSSIGKDSQVEHIKQLQNFLKEIGIYNGDIDGVYNIALINSIYTFQKEKDIVSDPLEVGAGYWGIQTRKKIQNAYKNGDFSKKGEKEKKGEILDIFTTAIGPMSPKHHIQELQKLLIELQYYDGNITGNYLDIMDTLVDYQLEKGLIQNKDDIAAGFFGPKTRTETKHDYNSFKAKKQKEEAFIKKMEDMKLGSITIARKNIEVIGDIKKGDVSPGVRELQKTLKKLGFFDMNDTGIFGDKTEESLFNYQKSKNLVQKSDDIGAGKIGPKTKETLLQDTANQLLEQEMSSITIPSE